MKKSLIYIVLCGMFLYSCNSSTNTSNNTSPEAATNTEADSEETESKKTGEFTVDGNTYKGEVTTQTFGNKNYSVLCQWNSEGSDYALLQITFHNESEALNNKNLTIYHGSQLPMTEPNPNDYTINLSGLGKQFGSEEFTGAEGSNGTITVSDKKITIKDMKLFTRSKETRTISASIPF